MPRHDVICDCGEVIEDLACKEWPEVIMHLDHQHIGKFVILWSSGSKQLASVHASERAAVWYHPKHGYRYPGRNDVPMPEGYKRDGFVRQEMNHLSDVQHLEKKAGVLSEVNHFDKGTGRDFMGNQG